MMRENNIEMILELTLSLIILFSSMANGLYSNGSLTKRPTNTAAVAGSNNITFECASSNGTDSISWSFTPLGSSSNETIWISSGYQLLKTNSNQPQYALNASINSSILVVLQLSSLTEGTYSCYDGVESVSALLLMIPSPISMEPLFGPVAGGTNITIIGSTTIEYLSRYIGSFIPNIKDVINVYVGNDLSAMSVSMLKNTSSAFDVLAVTPNTTEESIRQSLPIIIEFSPTPFNLTFNTAFTYLPNPKIARIYPNSFTVTGGTLLDVFGRYLSSVAKPIIQLKVVITRASETNSTSTTTTSRLCTVPPGNDTFMQCPMPPLKIPDDFLEILNSLYNTNISRTRRDIQQIDQLISDSHILSHILSRKKRDINALSVRGRNGIDQLDIYLGFILDGYMKYENINDALPDTRFVFFSTPEINSSKQLIEFNPTEEELIYLEGRNLLRGCRIEDYVVYIDNENCVNNKLEDNQLSCRPPKDKPSLKQSETNFCDQYLNITVTVGYLRYQYACLSYTDTNNIALIVGLTVGLCGFAILLGLIILIVCIVRSRRREEKPAADIPQNPGTLEMRNQPHYNNHMQQDAYVEYITYTRHNTITLYQPTDDYLTSIDESERNC